MRCSWLLLSLSCRLCARKEMLILSLPKGGIQISVSKNSTAAFPRDQRRPHKKLFNGNNAGQASQERMPPSLGASRALYLPFTASLMPPAVFRALPAALSALPSACVFESPVTLPAASLTEPLTCSAAPLMRSLSIIFSVTLARLRRFDRL